MSGAGRRSGAFNPDWEREIAAYDSACAGEEREFRSHHLVISPGESNGLTLEENEVLACVLRGLSAEDIAEMYGVEVALVTGLVAVIRAKLSLDD